MSLGYPPPWAKNECAFWAAGGGSVVQWALNETGLEQVSSHGTRPICLYNPPYVTLSAMKRRRIRLLALLWLGLYLWGPLDPTVDFWDSPQEEISDTIRSAGGAVTLVAAGFCIGLALFRKLLKSCSFRANAVRRRCLPLGFEPSIFRVLIAPSLTHSPPLPLRI